MKSKIAMLICCVCLLGIAIGWLWKGRFHSNNSYLLTSREDGAGLFSAFNTVVGALDFYEKERCGGLTVDFKKDGLYFDRALGPNWWNYYFEPIALGSLKNAKQFTSKEKQQFSLQAEFEMPANRAHELIEKYIHLKPEIQEEIDAFAKCHFEGFHVIGVHYRGTDKVKEASAVSYDAMEDEIAKAIASSHGDDWKIFVATDDQWFLEFMQGKWPGRIVAKDAIRSKDGTPVHFANKSENYRKGREAIVDCLLLSRCETLIKTASNLSDCSIQFNPSISVIRLNQCKYDPR